MVYLTSIQLSASHQQVFCFVLFFPVLPYSPLPCQLKANNLLMLSKPCWPLRRSACLKGLFLRVPWAGNYREVQPFSWTKGLKQTWWSLQLPFPQPHMHLPPGQTTPRAWKRSCPHWHGTASVRVPQKAMTEASCTQRQVQRHSTPVAAK